MGQALQTLSNYFKLDVPCYHSHAFRRGTCSTLKRCNLAVEDINVHMGWSLDSTQIKSYFRLINVRDVDIKFFYNILHFTTLNVGLEV